VPDVAAELGVSRVTVYRRVGPVDSMARLLLARELHRIMGVLPDAVAGHHGPDLVVAVVETVLAQALAHPVLTKVLTDDTETIGPLLVTSLPDVIDQAVAGTAPLLETAMAAGEIAPRDPRAVAEWLVRLSITLALAPPRGEVRPLLEELLVPGLAPPRS
jgi:AcrR family transcriptional regulator